MIKKENLNELGEKKYKRLLNKVLKRIDKSLLDDKGLAQSRTVRLYYKIPKCLIPVIEQNCQDAGWKITFTYDGEEIRIE